MFHVSLMVTAKQKPTVASQKTKRKKSKILLWPIINSQQTAGRKKQGKYKTARKHKMALVSSYLSIVTLNVNELNSPIERQKAGWLKKAHKIQLYAAYTIRHSLWLEAHT